VPQVFCRQVCKEKSPPKLRPQWRPENRIISWVHIFGV
jgi:hypothetical protein